MNRLLPIVAFLLATKLVSGQNINTQTAPRRVAIGLDVGRMPLVYLLRQTASSSSTLRDIRLLNIEPTIQWQHRTKVNSFTHVYLGYTTFDNILSGRNIVLGGTGFYAKLGREHQGRWNCFGWSGLVSHWQSRGQLEFPGSTFGQYTQTLSGTAQTWAGLEGHLVIPIRLADRWQLRIVPRLCAIVPLQALPDYPVVYVPGAGLTAGSALQFSGGLNIQIQYRVTPKTAVSY